MQANRSFSLVEGILSYLINRLDYACVLDDPEFQITIK